MKKNILPLYIAMMLIGIAGLFLYLNKAPTEPATTAAPAPKPDKVSITVAIASKALPAGTLLEKEDIQLKTLSVLESSSEKEQFDLADINPVRWALTSPVAEQSYIPRSALVKPGSDNYLTLVKQPDSVLYPITFPVKKEYLTLNLQIGQSIDIYLTYHNLATENSPGEGGGGFSYSAAAISSYRLKPLLTSKRVLDIRSKEEDQQLLIVELSHEEMKLIQGLLIARANLQIFPASNSLIASHSTNNTVAGKNSKKSSNGLSATESQWPISQQPLFMDAFGQPELPGMREMRGSQDSIGN